MKALITTLLMAMAALAAQAQATADSTIRKRLTHLTDSVIAEARTLYLYEYAAWHSADALTEAGIDPAKVGASGVAIDDKGILRYLYVDKQGDLLFEYMLDIQTRFALHSAKKRRLDTTEKEAIMMRSQAIDAIVKYYRDSITIAPEAKGRLNYDIIRLPDGTIRAYIIQGTTKSGYQPIGNDYVVDFDSRMRPLRFVRQHHSYMETPLLGISIHSHTPENLTITATDIANYMLYGYDQRRLGVMLVTITTYPELYVVAFYGKTFTAEIMNFDELKKKYDNLK